MITVLGIDPRATSPRKLRARPPLPFVSRRALARVKDRIEPPTECPFCGGRVELVTHERIYGRPYGSWPYAYACIRRACGAYVGLHPQTDLPLGTLADRATREARKAAKEPFLRIVRERFEGDRTAAYQWLSRLLGIEESACHFGLFSVEQCRMAENAIARTKGGAA